MASLPIPSPQQQALSQQLADLIQQKIKENNGWISFADFMHMALYTPSFGYYSGGATKFGLAGDFVTAPEISPLFAQTLANQAAQILAIDDAHILELGAGTGKLAADLLLQLQALNTLPAQYFILEVSDHLRQIQHETLQKKLPQVLFKRVVWLEKLPVNFVGLIIGNEVLDAIPAHLIVNTEAGLCERGVSFEQTFIWQNKPLQKGNLHDEVSTYSLPSDYLTEACPAAIGLINSLADCLKQGVILMLDYGFGAAEYYHPQRNQGTLMCHYQHYAHSNPLINIGLQDITAHVNFTAIADAGVAQGLSLAGYCNQASFLINCGMLDILGQTSPSNMAVYAPLAAAAQKLISPAEMGELFKVIAFSKNFDEDLVGFKNGDKAHTL
ncbi:MAG: SAM-dependent methyltransferase [Bdellovibrio sp.]|nr:SAM-dependent methyltransferase [Methylotenera sp.]